MYNICSSEDCTGCSACASVCPHQSICMVADEWGFKRPQVDATSCVDCGSCRKVCPALNKPERKKRLPEEKFYAAYHKDEKIRMESSSGGAFSALASVVLNRGGYVCAAAFDENYQRVRHIIIDSEKDMSALRTSKYTQSDMGTCLFEIKSLLQDGQEVFFVGTPCQVAGLHLFVRKEYSNLTTADIVCHGVPAPRIYQDYILWLENKRGSKLQAYSFRDKRWSWWRFNMKATFRNGECYYGKWETDPFFRGFLNDFFLRESCYLCQFSKHLRYSDITLSDFWGYRASDGGFLDDDKGISMCMLNTEKGEALFNDAKISMIHCPRTRQMSLENGGFEPREQDLQSRKDFLDKYQEKGFSWCLDSYFRPQPLTLRNKILYQFGRGSVCIKVYDKWKYISFLLKSPKAFAFFIHRQMKKVAKKIKLAPFFRHLGS